MAVVSLDQPPAWFQKQAQDHLSAAEARQIANTAGVILWHDPSASLSQPQLRRLLHLPALPVEWLPWQSYWSGATCQLVCYGLTPQMQAVQ